MVRLILYNIEYCEGIQGKWWQYLAFWKTFFPPKGLDDLIIDKLESLDPDVLALVEVDTGSLRSRKKDMGEYFKDRLAFVSLEQQVKYSGNGLPFLLRHIPIMRKQGNAVMSRYELSQVKTHELSHGTKRAVIEATLELETPVTLFIAHLALGRRTREKNLRELSTIIAEKSGPLILMGDFNTFSGEGELNDLLARTGLNKQKKFDTTLLTQPTSHPTRQLDYVLTSPEIQVKKYTTLHYPFSDHLPLLVDFEVSP